MGRDSLAHPRHPVSKREIKPETTVLVRETNGMVYRFTVPGENSLMAKKQTN